MQFLDSLTKEIKTFLPVQNRVVMYVCGLTPYDSAHIGHARTYVSFDVIKRYLIKKGYSVFHIQNITDVDDKIIKRCKETGANPKNLTEQNHNEALELFGQLHILPADVYPKVTEHIPQIIDLIKLIMDNGNAYETETGVYFDVSSFGGYGKLSGQDMEEIEAGSRKEVDESKNDPADFALWKKTKNEIIEFDSPWGRGRPGWHIECSAMVRTHAKQTLDIHGGARDLIFPHHENEIAQSEAGTKKKFCNCWMHTGFLTVNGEKMSKSLGNFITLRQALSNSTPNALRLFYLQAHYRSPLDYDEDNLQATEESVERIFNTLGLLNETLANAGSHVDQDFREKTNSLVATFYKNMENDCNTPEALSSLFSLLRMINGHLASGKVDHAQLRIVKNALQDMLWILGLEEKRKGLEEKKEDILALAIKLGAPKPETPEQALEFLIKLREDSRAAKDYKKSDEIRDKLKAIGIILEDKTGTSGSRWKII
ncbi:Cysteine--tRNA ligase [Candidatus Bilamarchaeum dharawalense]|uniref:Cysteine--tRNA ligase n=1 Tax=Candidatus Bilamarchaeum dharawalense TaxID=2885759 RepID=A0A5E4LPV7_9ARCH|nr:Cysteine--tRNA ligase [Candidatus Bilamarchaeum dharawalense]